MTEDEMKTKWCPHAKGQYPNETYCKAADCAIWESWEYEKEGESVDGETPLLTMNKGEGDCGLKTKECEDGCRL